MRILCITDQHTGSNHSSIEGIFNGALREKCDIYTVFFSKELQDAELVDNRLNIPYRYKRRGAADYINRHLPLDGFDVVIVRNFFPVLRSLLKGRSRGGYLLGFWNSFPHTYRRLFEAQQQRCSLLRKSLEYHIRSSLERRLVQRCDFLIAMSPEFRESFFDRLDIPFHPLPMGVTFGGLPQAAWDNRSGGLRMIYTGTVDPVRRSLEVISAISRVPGQFTLDIFTASSNETTRAIAALGDDRIAVQPPLPRQDLLSRMTGYDLGIGLIPENRLYNVSSPTKTIEYYGVGVPALVNHLPEYQRLLDADTAFFCDFSTESIAAAVQRLLATSRETLQRMGALGRERVGLQRDYRVLAQELHLFLSQRLAACHGSGRSCQDAEDLEARRG